MNVPSNRQEHSVKLVRLHFALAGGGFPRHLDPGKRVTSIETHEARQQRHKCFGIAGTFLDIHTHNDIMCPNPLNETSISVAAGLTPYA